MATKPSRDYLEIAYRSIQCFSDDGKLQPAELERLVAIAIKDGVVDPNEKRVLGNIIKRLNPAELTPTMQVRLAVLKSKYEI